MRVVHKRAKKYSLWKRHLCGAAGNWQEVESSAYWPRVTCMRCLARKPGPPPKAPPTPYETMRELHRENEDARVRKARPPKPFGEVSDRAGMSWGGCVGDCHALGGHRGPVHPVSVWRRGTCDRLGVFRYCDAATWYDRCRGLDVLRGASWPALDTPVREKQRRAPA